MTLVDTWPDSPRRSWLRSRDPLHWLAAIVVLGLGIRGVGLFLTWPTQPAGDEWDYIKRAVRLFSDNPDPDFAGRAPGLIFVYAMAFKLFGAKIGVAKVLNAVFSAAVLPPIYYLAGRLGGVRVGLVAALAAAAYPCFVAFSHFLWAEPLFILLMTCAIACVVWDCEHPRLGKAALAGALLGAAALCKESALVFPIALLGCLPFLHSSTWLGVSSPESGDYSSRSWRTGLLHSGVLGIVFGATLLPWVIHINGPGMPFAAVTRTSGMNLFIGNNFLPMGNGMEVYHTLGRGRLECEEIARSRALGNIRARLPL